MCGKDTCNLQLLRFYVDKESVNLAI